MSDIYSTLSFSPKKKRTAANFDADTLTPKRLRLAPPTPPTTRNRKLPAEPQISLSPHLTRLRSIQTSLQQALSHALASCAASPTSDTGILCNVTNHISLSQYNGLANNFTVEDLRRLCWLWEWDGKTIQNAVEDDDNPFLDSPSPSKDWKRGSMGFVISPATQFSKAEGKRVPAYGIGIEVEIDLDKDMGAGMAAVARWTSATETRRALFCEKLHTWTKMHAALPVVPTVPLANLPNLSSPLKSSSLTRVFASMSPKSSSSLPKELVPPTPSSPSRTSSKSPTKRDSAITASFHSIMPTKGTVLFPSTPTSSRAERTPRILNLRTPTSKISIDDLLSETSTPRGRDPASILQTPTTSRRQALYDRIRQRSLSASPSKSQRNAVIPGSKLTKDQIMKMGQEEMRRRCLLGRLGGVAESVWMLFSSASGSTPTSTPSSRKRRTLPLVEVATAVMKSSPVPISQAEANESLELLITLCPFFLKQLTIGSEDWLEMPSSIPNDTGSPSKRAPPSPGKVESARELMTRSPKRVKREAGGLREVREIVRRELELHD